MAPTLYMLDLSPPCRSVLMTAKLIDLELDIIEVSPYSGETKTPEFLKMNPQHTIPTLDDNGFYLWESHAIMPYLVDKYAKNDALYPKDLQKRATIDQRLHFNNSVLFSRLQAVGRKIIFEKTQPEQKDLDSLEEAFSFIETFLEKTVYIAGDSLTIADIALVVTLSMHALMGEFDSKKYPKTAAWMKKMEALPCYIINKIGLDKAIDFYVKK